MAGTATRRRTWAKNLAKWTAVATLILFMSWWGRAASLRGQLASARAEGMVTTIEELRMAPVPPEENAGPLYRAAAAMANPIWPDLRQLRIACIHLRRGPLPSAQWARAQATIDKIDPSLRLLRKAARLRSVDWRLDWNQGANLDFPEVGEAAGALCAVAELRAWKDPIGAFDDLAAVAKLSNATGKIPSLLGLEVQAIYVQEVVDKAQWILAHQPDSHALWEHARLIVANLGPEPNLRYSIRSELAVSRLAVFRDMIDRGGYDIEQYPPAAAPFANVRVIRHVFEANWVDYWRKVNRILQANESNYATALARIEALEDDLHCPHEGLEINIRWPEAMNRGEMPFISNSVRRAILAIAKRRMLEAAIDAKLVQLRTGRFPRQVSQIDPMDNRPLRVRLLPEGLLIYSVSVDRADDNGIPWTSGANQGNDDSFFVPAKPGVLPANETLRNQLMSVGW
jgi:hypothetical protein